MKIILLVLFFPFLCFAQKTDEKNVNVYSEGVKDSISGTSIVLNNHEVIFQKVYTSELKKEELSAKLNTLLSTSKMFRFNTNAMPGENEFFGKLINYTIDIHKYGGSQLGSPLILGLPFNGSVNIQVKDFKYRVIVSEMFFGQAHMLKNSTSSDVYMLNDEITERKFSKFKTKNSAVKLANFISLDLSDKFDLEKSYLSSDF